MDKVFFSENNKSKLVYLLRASGFGLGLQTDELLDIIKPTMSSVLKNLRSSSTVESMNQMVVNYHTQNKPRFPSPVVVRRNDKLSESDIESFMSTRNKFDISIGLKPTTYVKKETEEKRITKLEDPLDEYFKIL